MQRPGRSWKLIAGLAGRWICPARDRLPAGRRRRVEQRRKPEFAAATRAEGSAAGASRRLINRPSRKMDRRAQAGGLPAGRAGGNDVWRKLDAGPGHELKDAGSMRGGDTTSGPEPEDTISEESWGWPPARAGGRYSQLTYEISRCGNARGFGLWRFHLCAALLSGKTYTGCASAAHSSRSWQNASTRFRSLSQANINRAAPPMKV